ncbi:MAG: hypothetical protein V4726_16355 [Verrucomicrobiota bacterium]
MTTSPSPVLLAVSLTAIFLAGGTAGYFAGKKSASAPPVTEGTVSSSPEGTPEQWAENAFKGLANDLQLSDLQRDQLKPYLNTMSEQVFRERDRALLQIHLRLLEAHDFLAASKDPPLNEEQVKRLARSRAKLKAFILGRFADILRTNPGALPDL